MCGRYTLTIRNAYELEEFLSAKDIGIKADENANSYFAHYNIAPTHTVPVSHLDENGNAVIESMTWSFVRWKPKVGASNFNPFNARADKLLSSRMWNTPFQTTRCIIPLSGFYEWSGSKGNKTPHYIYPKGQPFFAAAGMYSNLGLKDSPHKTFTIITTAANNFMKPIHERMPAFLLPEEFGLWLNPSQNPTTLLDLLRPFPNDAMAEHNVSKAVGNVKNNHSGLIGRATLF